MVIPPAMNSQSGDTGTLEARERDCQEILEILFLNDEVPHPRAQEQRRAESGAPEIPG
jgi:hypothetical protein